MVSLILTECPSLEEFFREKIREAARLQNLALSEMAEFYLVELMSHFAISDNLFPVGAEGKPENKALALKLYDAVFDAPNRKFFHLKNLGDSALYQAGVFYEGLYNQVVSVDYYISMGGQAYRSLANLSTTTEKKASLADLFQELSESFADLVEVLKLACESDQANSSNDLLKLLDRYQKTKSQAAKKILLEKGIEPEQFLQNKISH